MLQLLNLSARQLALLRGAAYLLVFLLPLMRYGSASLGEHLGLRDLFAYSPLVIVFGVLTLADYLFGKDTQNRPSHGTPATNTYFKWLPMLVVPFEYALLIGAGAYFAQAPFMWWGHVGWILSMGVLSGILAINVAHELIHKESATERVFGGLLLAATCYGTFKVEHVFGHHAWVATPKDPSSAPRGMSVYAFVPRAMWRNFANAWQLQAQLLKRRGLPFWSVHNELIGWTALSVLIACGFTMAFGWKGLVFFVGQSVVAIALLETINFIEHYGLTRHQTPDGKYERVRPAHSWNSSYFLTNAFLFSLQRHSDHHAVASRRYQDLQHHENAPQLPGGYGAMILLSLLPPLWRRVIDPRIPSA